MGGSTIGSARTLNVVMSSDLCAGQNPGMAGAPLPLSLADTTANQPVFTMTAIESLLAAHRRIASRVSRTPLLSSSLLNQWLGHDIYFKAECLQKVGAFKARGACNAIAWLVENGRNPRRIVASSSGNHAQAVAWAAGLFGIPATVYMPANVSGVKARATESYGAQVVPCRDRREADARVADAAAEPGTFWVPPYNDRQVILGQGTAVYEALSDMGAVDAVFAPCGGGGLLSGSLIAARGLCPGAKVIGAEPLNANDAAKSLRAGSIQPLAQSPDTLADGAATLAVGDLTFAYLRQLDGFYEIEEEAIAYWCQWLNHLLKVRVEPTAALGMAAASRWLAAQDGPKTVLVVLSGGNIDPSTARALWRLDHLAARPSLRM